MVVALPNEMQDLDNLTSHETAGACDNVMRYSSSEDIPVEEDNCPEVEAVCCEEMHDLDNLSSLEVADSCKDMMGYPACDSNLTERLHAKNPDMKIYAEDFARKYQLEYLNKAKDGNIIVCLETGCGKTLIAVLLLKHLAYLFAPCKAAIAIFLVPTVNLVQQQAKAIESHSDLKVGRCSGQNDGESLGLWKWEQDVLQYEVLVMTPQILLNVLRHAFIKMETIKLLIFDECHHCQKDHPYARIMEEFYFGLDTDNRPRILGMTASPIMKRGKSETQYRQYIDLLELSLDSKIVTLKDRSELLLLIQRPRIHIQEFCRNYDLYNNWECHMKTLQGIKDMHCRDMVVSMDKVTMPMRSQYVACNKICRQLEYCMYELGLWFAKHAARHMLASNDNIKSEECIDASMNNDVAAFLNDVCEYLDSITPRDGELLEADGQRSDLVLDKVVTLVNVLSSFGASNLRVIVFVERVVTAKVLASYLSKKLKFINCDFIIGSHRRAGNNPRNGKSIQKSLEAFESGNVNLLVATNVAEEGLDIQACNLVVHFDMPKTLRSFVQSRGRARASDSHYVIFKERGNSNDEHHLEDLFESEGIMKEHISEHKDFSHMEQRNQTQDQSFKVEDTGATVNLQYSVQLLHRFCSKMSKDQLVQCVPEFHYVSEANGVQCEIFIPSPSPVKRVRGDICESRKAAKRAACLKACEILHSKGALSDFLLPVMPAGSSLDQHALRQKQEFIRCNAELHERIVPTYLSGRNESDADVIILHGYALLFAPVLLDENYCDFILLLKSPFPSSAATMCIDLYMSHGRIVNCGAVPCGEISLSHDEVTKAEAFQWRLFSVLLDLDLEHPSRTKSTDWYAMHKAWYLLLPLKDGQTKQCSQIDWETINKVTCTKYPMDAINMPIKDTMDAINASNGAQSIMSSSLHFANESVDANNACGSLVRTVFSQSFYCIIGVFKDLNSNSAFPNPAYQSYVEYYKQRHNHELVHRDQPLLKAKPLQHAYNLLLGRFSNKKAGSIASKKMLVELPPEVCQIEVPGLHDSLINTAAVLPSFMHRLESILTASQLRDVFGSLFPEGFSVSVEKVLEALTTQKCMESFSLERLELLGDSFLKYAVSSHLFLAHSTSDEGFLTSERSLRISNNSLYHSGIRHGLPGYILDDMFRPEFWVAPCHKSQVVCSDINLLELHGEYNPKKEGVMNQMCNKRHRWMQKKTIADVVEALIGAYLVDGGDNVALSFLRAIGFNLSLDQSLISYVQCSNQNNASLLSSSEIEALENIIGYKFKNKGLLIEAFTHASFRQSLVKSYQRLEFLGDSVLDYLITCLLFKKFKKLKPGNLTDLRSSVVNNESFARIAVQHKLYVYLLCESPYLANCIQKFAEYVQKSTDVQIYDSSAMEILGDWEGEKCPKILGDIVESLGGAIFVDGGFDLENVWRVFRPVLQPVVFIKISQLHPVRELLELCQKNHFELRHETFRSAACIFTFHVHTNSQEISGEGQANDKKSAKRQAAFHTLKKLKALGFVHQTYTDMMILLSEDGSKSESLCQDNLLSITSVDAQCDSYTRFKDASTNTDDGFSWSSSDGQQSQIRCKCRMDLSHERHYHLTAFDNSASDKEQAEEKFTDHSYSNASKPSSHSIMGCTLEPETHSNTHIQEWSNDEPVMESVGSESVEQVTKRKILTLPCDEATFHSPLLYHQNGTLGDVDMGPCLKGQARVKLDQICKARDWGPPQFICCYQDGMSHNKMYTYDIALVIPGIGKVQCYGDPRKSKKAAMDSAAEELLQWMQESHML